MDLPAGVNELLQYLVVPEHTGFARVGPGVGARVGGSTNAVLAYISEGEASAVEWNPEDQLLRWCTLGQPVTYARILEQRIQNRIA